MVAATPPSTENSCQGPGNCCDTWTFLNGKNLDFRPIIMEPMLLQRNNYVMLK